MIGISYQLAHPIRGGHERITSMRGDKVETHCLG